MATEAPTDLQSVFVAYYCQSVLSYSNLSLVRRHCTCIILLCENAVILISAVVAVAVVVVVIVIVVLLLLLATAGRPRRERQTGSQRALALIAAPSQHLQTQARSFKKTKKTRQKKMTGIRKKKKLLALGTCSSARSRPTHASMTVQNLPCARAVRHWSDGML